MVNNINEASNIMMRSTHNQLSLITVFNNIYVEAEKENIPIYLHYGQKDNHICDFISGMLIYHVIVGTDLEHMCLIPSICL